MRIAESPWSGLTAGRNVPCNAKRRADQALFGIVQGGVSADLRAESAQFIASLDTPGIAIGGLSVGETKEEMHAMLDVVTPLLPENKPRYLMGVGTPEDLINGVAARHRHLRLRPADASGAPSLRLRAGGTPEPDERDLCARRKSH